MTSAIDALTSHTLKHLRERWWDDAFTTFIVETLRPRSGHRILDVGCGEGLAELSLRRQQISQLQIVGVDLVPAKLGDARRAVEAHNYEASFAAADACSLPFRDGVFDAIFCVAVLQHVVDVEAAVRECVRVTRPGGRVMAVEPDNSARYFHSSVSSGRAAFDSAHRLFDAIAAHRGSGDGQAGPRLPGLFARQGVEAVSVRFFPVAHARLGQRDRSVWQDRRAAVARVMGPTPTDVVRAMAADHLRALEHYEADARDAGSAFVEIQHTMLLATVGARTD